jgi:hypothetical protein
MSETFRCGICGRSIVRGQALSYAHAETTPKGETWFAHSARPRQSVEPSTARPSAPSSGRGQVDGSTDLRERITGTTAGT